ncbi:WD repeat domain-containing protein 83 [Hydra vulgaris]|uniref:WD repeat domain-containing protein 83 n=1 Tax=Hydra vulgaris TaxID=6087 RepID=T2M6N0_HYDVU
MSDDFPVHLQTELKHPGAVSARAIIFNKDGDYCLTCGSDKSLRLWNPYKGTLLKTYNGHGYEVLGCDASADNSKVTSCSADRTVVLWDVGTGQVLRKYRGHLSRVNSVRFNSQDGSIIVSGSYDSTVRCWDTRSRSLEAVQILDDAKDSIPTLQVSEHEILTGSVDGYVRLYDLRQGKLTEDCMADPVTSVSFTNDGQCILASTLDSKIRLIDKQNGAVLNTYTGHINKDYKIDSTLLLNDTHIISGSENSSIVIWDLIHAKIAFEFKNAHSSAVYSISRHPSKNYILAASTDSSRLWVTKSFTD